jgi:hypothetical protein
MDGTPYKAYPALVSPSLPCSRSPLLPTPIPTPLSVYMADKGPLWESIVRKYHLEPIPYGQIASWGFEDFIFNSEFDNISSTIKARRAGFSGLHALPGIDTQDMFRSFFESLRQGKLIP